MAADKYPVKCAVNVGLYRPISACGGGAEGDERIFGRDRRKAAVRQQERLFAVEKGLYFTSIYLTSKEKMCACALP